MFVLRRAVHGIAWSAARMWVQMLVGAGAFLVVARCLSPAEVGAFGVVALLVGLVEASTTAPLAEGLQQRRELTQDQVGATFWLGLAAALVGVVALWAGAMAAGRLFAAPAAGRLLPWAALGLLAAPASGVMAALLARELRFGESARAGLGAGLVAGALQVGLAWAGAGVAALVAADLVGRLVRLVLLWRATRWRPPPPRDLGAIRALMRFNLATLAAYWLGTADRMAPRLLAGVLLGAGPLGYLVLGQRLLDLVFQLVVAPIGSVAMAAVARLQHDRAELQRLVLSLYRLAALAGYPAFLGAAVLAPDLAHLLGTDWVGATPVIQLLLLVGLRTTTGAFNLPILRGLGHNRAPLVLLAAGLALNLVLVPLAAGFGSGWVAAAMLARTLATWPLGCAMLQQATGLSPREQLRPGLAPAAAAVAMAALVALGLHLAPTGVPLARLAAGAAGGAALYAALLAMAEPRAARAVLPMLRGLLRGDRAAAAAALRAGMGA